MGDGDLAGFEKKCIAEERTCVFVDESGFYLLPSVVKTYAPIGETPVLSVPLTRDHLSAISGITEDGRLLIQVKDHSIKGIDCVEFLKHLLRHIPGKLMVIWDGSTIHRCQPVKDFLKTEQGQRLWLESLPAYAPDLNPDEGIWRYTKRVELKNVCCHDLDELHEELIKAIARLRHKKHVIKACFQHAGL